jgi:hypothetical protein
VERELPPTAVVFVAPETGEEIVVGAMSEQELARAEIRDVLSMTPDQRLASMTKFNAFVKAARLARRAG